jgi:glycosyltransferase involved in cell wall biosynthesis
MERAAAIDVVIPAFNRRRLLAAAIESVFGQTCRNFRCLVVDDGSRDGTGKMVEQFGPAVVYLRQENRGPAAARNRGIRAGRAPLVAFLDSDDRWLPEKLEIQAAAMAREKEYLISHTQETWYRRGELLPQKKRHLKPEGDIFARALEICVVSMSTVMVRRELFDRAGYFDEDLPCCEDYDFWLRASLKTPFLLVDRSLTVKEGGRPDQVSAIYREGMDRYRIRSLANLIAGEDLTAEQENLARAELKRKCRIFGNGALKRGREEEGRYYLALPDQVRSAKRSAPGSFTRI